MTTQTLAVLNTMLSESDADWYGLELCGRAGLKPGTVYPILDRLFKVQWLERHWEDVDPKIAARPRRRLYRLTGVGKSAARQALDEHLGSLQASPMQRHVDRTLVPEHKPADRSDNQVAGTAAAPLIATETVAASLIATLVEDDLVARHIERALADDGMSVKRLRSRSSELNDVDALEADVLVVALDRRPDEHMRQLRRRLPLIPIVVVMPEDSRHGVRRALELGADGIVFESDLEQALSTTVRAALMGQTAVPAARRHEVDRPSLSSREKEVLGMVVSGKSNKAIASELFLAESTVKAHLSSAFAKLGVRSRNEAADLILQSGAEFGLPMRGFSMPGTTPS